MTEPKTVNVRIAVAVDKNGEWRANGWNGDDGSAMGRATDWLEIGVRCYWVTATLPIPEAQEIAGKVEDAADA